MAEQSISKQTLMRLPLYLNYLKTHASGEKNISATQIAAALGLNQVQVRKDLAAVTAGGRPKTGYVTDELIRGIAQFLGYDALNRAVIVGAGRLGRALLGYDGFSGYGLEIVAAFDSNPQMTGEDGKTILPMEKLPGLCKRMGVKIGIITVPAAAAQTVCDVLIESGIRAIWNFAPVHLNVPAHVLVQNENMAASLAVLGKHLSEMATRGEITF